MKLNSKEPSSESGYPETNIIIICARLLQDRSERGSRDFLQSMSALHLGSLIDRKKYNLKIHLEDWHGPYNCAETTGVDICVLTGLQTDFDRMRQLAYSFRSAGAKVVAGGSLCTLFPRFASQFFDTVCAGGVEAFRDFLTDYEIGETNEIYYSSSHQIRDYEIDHGLLSENGIDLPLHLIEASRGCSFRCDFCVLPAENALHAKYKLERVAATIDDAIKKSPLGSARAKYPIIWFIDNNFIDNRAHMKAVVNLLARNPKVKAWGAMLTQDALRDRDLINLLVQSKCKYVFVGIESLDENFLKSHRKKQNLSRRSNVIDDVIYAEKQGLCVGYGYLFDPETTSVETMRRQLRHIGDRRDFPLPCYCSFVTPLLGTGFFWKCARERRLMPNVRLRDLDCETIVVNNTISSHDEITVFARELLESPGRLFGWANVVSSTLYRLFRTRSLNPYFWFIAVRSNLRMMSFASRYSDVAERSFIAGQDRLDPQYANIPDGITEADRRKYFEPIMITGNDGQLASWLMDAAPKDVLETDEMHLMEAHSC